jgi:TIR domain
VRQVRRARPPHRRATELERATAAPEPDRQGMAVTNDIAIYDVNLMRILGFFAGLVAGAFFLPLPKQPLLGRVSFAFVGLGGLLIAFSIGHAITLSLPLVIGSSVGARFVSSGVGMAVAGLIVAGVLRLRQAERDADEGAGGRAESPAAEKAVEHVDKPAPPSAPTQRATQARIFISYRREGEAALAGRIADLLGNQFGPDNVFMDVDAIRLGVDFVKVINEEVAKCDVLLALIGRNWLDARNEAGERVLDNSDDFVRLEIAAALKRQIPVIPILVDGAKIPPANRLPEELQGLARRNALDLRNASFRADMDKLVVQLKTSKGS